MTSKRASSSRPWTPPKNGRATTPIPFLPSHELHSDIDDTPLPFELYTEETFLELEQMTIEEELLDWERSTKSKMMFGSAD